jgi:Flp pilus assembly protein TadD
MRFLFEKSTLAGAIAALLLLLAGLMAGCEQTQSISGDPGWSSYSGEEADFADPDAPPSAKTLYSMGRILIAKQKDAEAAYVLNRTIATYPRFMPAYCDLAEIHMRNNQVEQAMHVLTAGLAISPDDPVLHNDLGMCYLVKNQAQAAFDEFAQAAAARPEDTHFRANMAVALGMLGRYDESLALFMQVVPQPEAHYNLGILCEANNDTQRAADAFAQAEKLGLAHAK